MRKILVSSIGSRVSQAIVDALGRRRPELTVIGTNSDSTAASNFWADVTYLVPVSAKAEAFRLRMHEILLTERPDLVIAGRDGDLETLAQLKAEPDLAGICFLTPPPAVVAIVRDKHRTFEFAHAHGLPFAESAVDIEGADRLIAAKGLPLIAKPRGGHSAIGVSVVTTRDQALAALAAGGVMLQEFLNPPDDLAAGWPDLRRGMPLYYSVPWHTYLSPTAILDESGGMLSCNTVRITKEGGVTASAEPVDDPAIERFMAAYVAPFAELGLVGPLNVQCCEVAKGSFVPFELNARFTGTSAARACLGFNEVLLAIDYFLEGKRPSPAAAQDPAFVVRMLVDRLVRRADVQRLASQGSWRPDR